MSWTRCVKKQRYLRMQIDGRSSDERNTCVS